MSSSRPVALVTGSAQGLGLGTAHELARNGFDVVVSDLHAEADLPSGLLDDLRTHGTTIANLGFEAVTFAAPVFCGDTIHAETRVLDVQESKSKNDRGVVTVETKGFNQDGKEVCYFRRRVMVWKREFMPKRARPYDGQDVWNN